MSRRELEQRMATRYPPSIYVSLYHANNHDFFGLLADLSETGFKLVSDSEIVTDQHYTLSACNPFSVTLGDYITFTVNAIWCRKNDDELYEAGFQFTETNDESEKLFSQLTTDFEATA